MDEATKMRFSQEVVPLYDLERREMQLPQELRPVEMDFHMPDEWELWRKEHGEQDSII